MDKGRSQRLKIARQVAAWGTEIPALRVRIAGAVAKPSVPGRQKIELEVMARHITMLVNAIGEMPGPDEADTILYDR
jgi:ribosomal 50S subunit-recycling heat shock protein